MTNTTQDLSTATPPEIDSILADLWERQARAEQYAEIAAKGILENGGGYEGPWNRRTRNAKTFTDCLLTLADGFDPNRYVDSYRKHSAQVVDLVEQARPYVDEYARRGGWSRFFLVKNDGGHIHSSMACSTCFPTTQFGWLPQLSGLDEAAAVADQGEILCSICFPSAPVAWTNGTSKASQAEKDARAAAKAERAAKKLAKALLPDGSELVVETYTYTAYNRDGSEERRRRTERISTLAAAKTFLTDVAERNGGDEYNDAVRTVSEAVAAKTGETVAEVLAAAAKRAAKRR